MQALGFTFEEQQANLKYLLSRQKRGFTYEELHYLLGRINYTMYIRYGFWPFSAETCNWIYFFIEDCITFEDLNVTNYEQHLSEAFIEVTNYEYKRWKYFGRFINKLKTMRIRG